ncbi:MAG: YezD family protein [Coriobacteriales bacterium]|jgi:hypothetical protein|nr:YezD family protein [Coriobacteriales bacterium]
MSEQDIPAVSNSLPPDVIRRLKKAATGLQYGTITLVFHGGKVIQIERNEKLRLNSPQGSV